MKKAILIVIGALVAILALISVATVLLSKSETVQNEENQEAATKAVEWDGKAEHIYNLAITTPDGSLEVREAAFTGLRGVNAKAVVKIVVNGARPDWLAQKRLRETFSASVGGAVYRKKLLTQIRGPELNEQGNAWNIYLYFKQVPTRFLSNSLPRLVLRIDGVMRREQPIAVRISAEAPTGYQIGDQAGKELKALKAKAKKKARQRAQAKKRQAKKKARQRARQKSGR